jgi:hypothetical protein
LLEIRRLSPAPDGTVFNISVAGAEAIALNLSEFGEERFAITGLGQPALALTTGSFSGSLSISGTNLSATALSGSNITLSGNDYRQPIAISAGRLTADYAAIVQNPGAKVSGVLLLTGAPVRGSGSADLCGSGSVVIAASPTKVTEAGPTLTVESDPGNRLSLTNVNSADIRGSGNVTFQFDGGDGAAARLSFGMGAGSSLFVRGDFSRAAGSVVVIGATEGEAALVLEATAPVAFLEGSEIGVDIRTAAFLNIAAFAASALSIHTRGAIAEVRYRRGALELISAQETVTVPILSVAAGRVQIVNENQGPPLLVSVESNLPPADVPRVGVTLANASSTIVGEGWAAYSGQTASITFIAASDNYALKFEGESFPDFITVKDRNGNVIPASSFAGDGTFGGPSEGLSGGIIAGIVIGAVLIALVESDAFSLLTSIKLIYIEGDCTFERQNLRSLQFIYTRGRVNCSWFQLTEMPPASPVLEATTAAPTQTPKETPQETPGPNQETPARPNQPDNQEIPPLPWAPGNSLEPGGDPGEYVEIGPGGIPLGVWNWDAPSQSWIFDEYPPLAVNPHTGSKEIRFNVIVLGLMGLGALAITRKRRAKTWFRG